MKLATAMLCTIALSGGVLADGFDDHRGVKLEYKVTIENLTATQPLSPPVLATHKQRSGMFRVGGLASPGLEAIAENGNQIPMFNRFNDPMVATNAVDVGRPLTPNGQTVGSFTDSATFTMLARPGDRLSMATMLICTNDGFTGLDLARPPLFGSAAFLTKAYDAGTEENTELSMDIVDPCSGLGPVTIGGDPDGNLDKVVDTTPHEAIGSHPGILEIGDLLDAHNWNGPVAKVTMTRIDRDATAFLAQISGNGEVPPVDSAAHGWTRLRLVDGETPALKYQVQARNLVGAVQGHIHHGPPNENGPVVAFLFGPQDPSGLFSGELAEGTIEESDLVGPLAGDMEAFVEALRTGELYVNVHTADNPSGELRGQIGAAHGIGRGARRLRQSALQRLVR